MATPREKASGYWMRWAWVTDWRLVERTMKVMGQQNPLVSAAAWATGFQMVQADWGLGSERPARCAAPAWLAPRPPGAGS